MASGVIYLRLLQAIEPTVTAALQGHIERLFGIKCVIDQKPLNIDFAFVPLRNQYNSTSILARLKAALPNNARALLAVIEDDLFATGLNFVFGEAEVGGHVAIISLARLLPTKPTGPDGPDRRSQNSLDIFQARAIKEATHELGHVMGLRHCNSSRCVMYFSNTIEDTDAKSEKFCPDCLHLLAEILR